MKKIKVSVIIPIYNAELKIKRCLEHLVKQTLSDIEIIVVNDGSTDKSEDIIKKYLKLYDNIIYLKQENSGVSNARNSGIKKSRGKYICFCDSDDYYEYDALENMFMNSNDADIVVSKVRKKMRGNVEFSTIGDVYLSKKSDINEIIIKMTKNHMINQMWCKLFKRELIIENNIMLNSQLSIGEDLEWMSRFFYHVKSLCGLDIVTYNYIIDNNESLSQKFNYQFFEQNVLATNSLKKLYQKRKINFEVVDNINFSKCWESLMLINSNTCSLSFNQKKIYINKIITSDIFKNIVEKKKTGGIKRLIMRIRNTYILIFVIVILKKKC